MAFAKSLLQKMLQDATAEDHFDVRLVVEGPPPKCGETVIRAHRLVLSTVSEVFRAMFAAGLKDQAEGVVRVSDFTPGAVAEALAVIYGGELGPAAGDWKLAGQVWDFGHRFRIAHVAELARAAALAQVSEENCLRVLGFALYVGDDAAAEQLRAFVADPAHFLRVVRSAEFAHASHDVVAALRRPGAGAFVEPDILTFEKVWFDALLGWARAPQASGAKDANGGGAAGGNGSGSGSGSDAALERRVGQMLRLVDFARMRTHELRDAYRAEGAAGGGALAGVLVGVLLARAEKLEALNFEKDRDLEELGQAYQMALFGKSEADRNVRLTSERLEKVASGKARAEKRDDDDKALRRTSGNTSGVPLGYPYLPSEHRGSSSGYSARRKAANPPRSPIL